MYNPRPIGKIVRCFLSTGSIDGISLCAGSIEVQLYHLVLHIGQKHFNALKSVLYVEKSAVGQVITFNKSVMSRKRSLVTAIPSLKHDQVMSKTYNAGSWSMKVLIMIKT